MKHCLKNDAIVALKLVHVYIIYIKLIVYLYDWARDAVATQTGDITLDLSCILQRKASKHALKIKSLMDQYLQTPVPSLELELAETDGCKQQQQRGSLISTEAWTPFLLMNCACAAAAACFT